MSVKCAQLETALAQYFGKRYCLLLGSGTTSLYITLKSLQLPIGTRVLFPNNTCETAVNASIFAGLSPVFCDVSSATMFPTRDQVVKAIADYTPRVYVATHLFGLRSQISNLPLDDIIVVEDAAQSYGLPHGNSNIKSIGDATIISFGNGKTLDCSGGGALLTNERDIYESAIIERESIELPYKADTSLMQQVFLLRRKFAQESVEFQKEYKKLLFSWRFHYLSCISLESVKRLAQKIDELESISMKRIEKFKVIRSEILEKYASDILFMPNIPEAHVIWQLPFTIKAEMRDKIAIHLESDGYRVNKFFKPLHRTFFPRSTAYPQSEELFSQIINIA